MKKIILMSSIIFASITLMNAQTTTQRTPEERAKSKVMQISKSGALQNSQVDKISKLFIEFYTNQDALKAKQTSLDATVYQKQMTDLKTQHNNSLKAVLTPEQLKSYEEAEVKRQQRNTAAQPHN